MVVVCMQVRKDMKGPWAGLPLLTCTWHVRKGTAALEDNAEPDTSAFSVTLPPLLPASKGQLADAIHEEFIAPLLPPKGGAMQTLKSTCCFCC